jgi:tRNA A-37 threonylcarbamoyl transferase component Bud32
MSNYKFIVNPEYKSYTKFVERLPQIFETEGTTIYEGRNLVKVYEEKGEKFVVKRYKRPMIHQRIDYTFLRKSKARRAYDYALRLKELSIDTPEAVACVEEHKFGLFRTGYFVSTICTDPELKILRETPDEKLIDAFAHFIVKMHEQGVLHGDLNLSNILYREDTNEPHGYHFTVIDTNRSRFVEQASKQQCLRNMVRISHIRDLNKLIIGRYAEIRGWDKDECITSVERMLDAFEKKRRIKRKIKLKK